MTRFRKIESISLSNEEFFEIKKGRFSKKGIDYVERSVDLIDPVPHVMPVELNRFSIFSSLSQTRFCLKKDHADRLHRLVPERSILLSTISSSLGKASLCINPVSINQFVVGVIIKDKSIPDYIKIKATTIAADSEYRSLYGNKNIIHLNYYCVKLVQLINNK